MAINNNFLNWHTAEDLAGYADGPTIAEISDCLPEKQYVLPVRSADTIKFIFVNELTNPVKVALLRNGVTINANIGTLVGNYGTVIFPLNLPFGMYNLLIYQEVRDYTSDWYETSWDCIKVDPEDPESANTGQRRSYQSRTYEVVNTAVALSDCIRVGVHKNTNVIRFRNDGIAFGFDYTADDEFFQQFRLHIEVVQPDYPLEESVYRQTNGYRRFGNVSIDEKQELRTYAFDQRMHQCMVSALKHGYFFIGACQYFMLGAYKIDPTERALAWTASADIFTQEFDLRNWGCTPAPVMPPVTGGDYSTEDYSG